MLVGPIGSASGTLLYRSSPSNVASSRAGILVGSLGVLSLYGVRANKIRCTASGVARHTNYVLSRVEAIVDEIGDSTSRLL